MDSSTSPNVKYVSVTVTGGVISCTPDPVEIKKANTLVVCQLVTAGYHFPAADAIVVTVPGSDFPYSSWTLNATTAAVYDQNGVVKDYKYSVTVVDNTTNVPITLDPIIRNGGTGTP